MPTKATPPLLLSLVLLTAGCASGEHLTGARPGRSARPQPPIAVTRPVAVAGLETSRDIHAGHDMGLTARLVIQPSFEEVLAFPDGLPVAATYRFRLEAGERIDVRLSGDAGAPELIADVFEVVDSTQFHQVFRADSAPSRFTYVAATEGDHVLRLQTPEGRSGRYTVRVEGSATGSLVLPVAGMTAESIEGVYGDARDGGARDHKGVDIFAPRGTPVIAVADGVITTVESTGTGGRVVWQRDDKRNLMYFYAHLDEQLATEGRRVMAGDTIGLVGNTGNARGSSPHLHFGVYLPGYRPDDPARYLRGTGIPADRAALPRELGLRVKLPADRVRLRASPNAASPILRHLPAGTDLLVFGYVNGWTRVVLDDGRSGFVAGWLVSAN